MFPNHNSCALPLRVLRDSGGWQARRVKWHLRRGGVIAYPTQGVYGLGVHPRNALGLRQLARLKGRSSSKGFIVLGAEYGQLQCFTDEVLTSLDKVWQAKWPGHYTWLFPVGRRVFPILRGKTKINGKYRIALRLDNYAPVRALCQALNSPIVSTSANFRGQRPCTTPRQCLHQWGRRVLVLGGRVVSHQRPSPIQDAMTGKMIRF
ncbi:MAG: L-threonylcarbamoyladenylate synthase [Ferrovum sp.]|jgi:L-threonylcarbamoyladenylate synthase|nr:L-threonylcarbamoyladenylate synthase [Ferrovum sp.]